jgi:hypothetical protein
MDDHSSRNPEQPEPAYTAFLIRCWYEDGRWRFFLETIGPARHTCGFSSTAALWASVQALLDDAAAGNINS